MQSEPTHPIQTSRIRFGLKTLFVVMTAVCFWLGYRVILERRANEIAARHDAILVAITEQMPSPSALRMRSIPPGNEDELLSRLEQTGKNFRRTTMLRVDHSDSTAQNPAVDVLKLLASKTHPTTIADKLAQHYGSALAAIGFHQIFTHGGSRSDLESVSGSCRGIWSSPTSDMFVVIDGEVFVQSKSAMVTILLIDSQQLHLW